MISATMPSPPVSPTPVSSTPVNDDARKGGLILVIDDELGPRESIRFLFKGEYDVLCADRVQQGVEYLQAESPDVIILDIKMPGKSGIEGLLDLRAIDPDVSIVMLTGFGSLKTAQMAMRNGANDYIRKPFDTKEMRDTVNRYVQRTRVERRRAGMATELRGLNTRLRNELVEKEALADMGRLSSEFVHDLRNPLTVIYGYVNLLSEDLASRGQSGGSSNEETAEYLSIIEKNVHRCEEMLTQWRNSRHQDKDAPRKRISVPALLCELVDNAKPVADEAHSEVHLIPPQDTADVLAQETEIYRALQNLITNAIQALPEEGGRVEISMTIDSGRAVVRVRDDGPGIPPDQLEAVLTPNFTTKRDKGGMGLGLYITSNIIESHGGHLRLANNPDRGITATVALPLMPR